MEEKVTNPSISRAILLSVVAIPVGICGWFSMFFVPTPGMVYLTIGISVACSIAALLNASNGLEDLKQNEGSQKGKGLAGASIILSLINISLVVYYFASY